MWALCQRTITDLVLHCIPSSSPQRVMQDLPQSIDVQHPPAVWRIHQALFHDWVKIEKKENKQYQLYIPSVQYRLSLEDTTLYSEFWGLQQDFVMQQTLLKENIDIQKLPPLPTEEKKDTFFFLTKPYSDTKNGVLFSIGTAFRIEEKSFQGIATHYYHPTLKKLVLLQVPYTHLIFSLPNPDTRKTFLFLLSQLLDLQPKIPYVFGGCSWHPSYTSLFSGFDCSGLILKMAQLAGIPLLYKNTLTLMQYLPSLQDPCHVEPGDLICFKGHVMVISSLKPLKIIHAVGIQSLYASVVEVFLQDFFQSIDTLNKLFEYMTKPQAISLLNKNGTPYAEVTHFKVLKLL